MRQCERSQACVGVCPGHERDCKYLYARPRFRSDRGPSAEPAKLEGMDLLDASLAAHWLAVSIYCRPAIRCRSALASHGGNSCSLPDGCNRRGCRLEHSNPAAATLGAASQSQTVASASERLAGGICVPELLPAPRVIESRVDRRFFFRPTLNP